MSVQPSLLKCPSCADQLLETVTTALGSLERCPSCLSLWVEQKLIAAYSDDKTVCRDALAETKTLLLPADRWCPKCFQKMVDGRVRSRSVVLHLCVTCEALWIDWETLRKFDEFIERALKAQVEAASLGPLPPQTSAGSTYLSGSAPVPAWTQIEDTGVGKVFRSMARTFDSIADGVGGTSAYTQPPKVPKPVIKKPPVKTPAPKIPKEPVKESKERKILKADELPPDPITSGAGTAAADAQTAAVSNTQTPAAADVPITATPEIPLMDLSAPLEPETVVAETPAPPQPVPVPVEEKATSHVMDFRSILETLEEQERVVEIPPPAPVVSGPAPLPPVEIHGQEPKPMTLPAIEPLPPVEIRAQQMNPDQAVPVIPAPEEKVIENVEPEVDSSSAISHLLGGAWDDEEEKPAKKNKEPAPPTAPVAKPVFSKPEKKGPGLFGKLSAAFKPKPRTAKPIVPPPSLEIKKTAPAPPATPVVKAIAPKPVKKEDAGIATKKWGIFKSKPKAPKPAPIIVPEKPASPKPAPLVEKKQPVVIEPIPSADVVKSAAVPKPIALKPAAKPKVVGPKTKRNPAALVLRLLPWILAVVAFLINYARGYDFELSFALLWSACAWSVGTMIRLFLLYPFQDFMEISLSTLLDYPGLSAAKGFPVTLMGQLEPENPDIPKGPLAFVQDEKKLGLNKTGALELTSTFFGLKNPAQFTPGEATLKGWYRKTEPPYLEVSVALIGKKRRTSSVRALRWAAAISVLVVAGLILMTAE